MKQFKISINQIADYLKGSSAKRNSIIRNQKKPNKFMVSWYQLPKSRIKKSISLNDNLFHITDGIRILRERKPEKPRQIMDKEVSIEALKRYTQINLPDFLRTSEIEFIKKVDIKSVIINDVEVVVSPDLIFRVKKNDRSYLGAIKLHISKNNVFDLEQSKCIATLLHKYLSDVVADKNETVSTEFCLAIEIFGQRVVKAPRNLNTMLLKIASLCDDLKLRWNVA